MTIVSSKEFAANQSKYYNMAVNDEVFIKRGKDTFRLIYTNADGRYDDETFLEPDDNLRSAMTVDEVRKKLYGVVDKLFATE